MPAWLAIAAVMVLVAVLLNPGRDDFAWFLKLQRPRWLTFERWIPLIWMAIYGCFYASALLTWQAGGRWLPMLGYLGLQVLVQSYTLLICRTRRLQSGTAVGFAGWVWGVGWCMGWAVCGLGGELPSSTCGKGDKDKMHAQHQRNFKTRKRRAKAEMPVLAEGQMLHGVLTANVDFFGVGEAFGVMVACAKHQHDRSPRRDFYATYFGVFFTQSAMGDRGRVEPHQLFDRTGDKRAIRH